MSIITINRSQDRGAENAHIPVRKGIANTVMNTVVDVAPLEKDGQMRNCIRFSCPLGQSEGVKPDFNKCSVSVMEPAQLSGWEVGFDLSKSGLTPSNCPAVSAPLEYETDLTLLSVARIRVVETCHLAESLSGRGP